MILQNIKKSAVACFFAIILLLILTSLDNDFYANVTTNILSYFCFFFVAFFIGFLTSSRVKIIYLGIVISGFITFVITYGLNQIFSNTLFKFKLTSNLVSSIAVLISILTYLFSINKKSLKNRKKVFFDYPLGNSLFFFFTLVLLYSSLFVRALGEPYKDSLRFLFDILFIDSLVFFCLSFFIFKYVYQNRDKEKPIVYGYYIAVFLYYLLVCFFKYERLESAMNIQNFLSYLIARIPFIYMIIASVQISFLIQNSKNQKTELKEQSLEAQLNYQHLKNQLSPHFLFNNINVLTSLIEEDTFKAVRFSENLSNIYRYFLEQEKQDIVMVNDEITFAKSYLQLLKDRFEKGLSFNIDVDIKSKGKYVVSTVLQQVLENVIKHNTINKTNTISVNISASDDYLIVENNKNDKLEMTHSSKKGIENIKKRMAFFTDKKIIIINNQTHYSIKIPLLEIV